MALSILNFNCRYFQKLFRKTEIIFKREKLKDISAVNYRIFLAHCQSHLKTLIYPHFAFRSVTRVLINVKLISIRCNSDGKQAEDGDGGWRVGALSHSFQPER